LHTGVPKKFDFIEKEPKGGFDQQPGFVRFLRDTSPCEASEEIELVKKLNFKKSGPHFATIVTPPTTSG
jgi:hypothetical protein